MIAQLARPVRSSQSAALKETTDAAIDPAESATDQFKQPGSSVKPFLDYALAFEYLGWSTSHVVTDKPIAYTKAPT